MSIKNTMAEVDQYTGTNTFSRFTLAGDGNKWIFINPSFVAAVIPGQVATEIVLADGPSVFKKTPIKVKEPADVVLARLNG